MNYCIEALRVIQVYYISLNTFIVIVSPRIKTFNEIIMLQLIFYQ